VAPAGTARVAVITLGGTIAMTSDGASGATPRLSARDLVAAVPGLDAVGELQVQEFRRLPGASLTYADLFELATHVESLDVDGVVITQGTDTVEETAYALDLLLTSAVPVVFTGAMRTAGAPGADGPANLLTAVRVAATPDARGLGALVVFGDEVHAARWVRKTHTSSLTAFTSYPGPIGYVAEDRVAFWTRPHPHPPLTTNLEPREVRTAVATIALGDDETTLAAIGGVVDGLVVAAFGVGHVPVRCVDTLGELVTRIPVVLASRTGTGPVLTGTYGFPGSEMDLLHRGLIPAGPLDPVKAKVLLHLLLSTGHGPEQIADRFRHDSGLVAAVEAGRA